MEKGSDFGLRTKIKEKKNKKIKKNKKNKKNKNRKNQKKFFWKFQKNLRFPIARFLKFFEKKFQQKKFLNFLVPARDYLAPGPGP